MHSHSLRRVVAALLCYLVLASSTFADEGVHAQGKDPGEKDIRRPYFTTAIGINPFYPMFLAFSGTASFGFNYGWTLFVTGATERIYGSITRSRSAEVGLGMRHYFGRPAHSTAWFASVEGKYAGWSYQQDEFSEDRHFFEPSVRIGRHWVWSNGFHLLFALGPTYAAGDEKVTLRSSSGATREINTPNLDGWGATLILETGYAF